MRFTRTRLIGAAAAATMLFAAACGGGGSDNDGIADGTDPNIPAGSPFIDQDVLKFHPTSLSVGPGVDVYFKNSETALHTVTIEGENVSGNMRKDDIFVWTSPSALGEYQVTCDYHPQMKATITVAEQMSSTPAQ